jgi:hypothetical protein
MRKSFVFRLSGVVRLIGLIVIGCALGPAALSAADVPAFTKVTGAAFGTSPVNCVTYGGGKFVAGGDDGKTGVSTDGISWKAAANSGFGSTRINGIAYGAGKFVAVGDDGKMAYSPDGIAWTLTGEGLFAEGEDESFNGNGNVICVTYGGGKFVAGGGLNLSKIAWSTDGITWNVVSDLPFPFSYSKVSSITHDDAGNYYAFSYNGMGVQTTGAYSADAVTWTISIRGPYSEKSAVVYSGGKFVFGFDHILGYTDGKAGSLANGFNWENDPPSIFGSSIITCLAYGAELFLAGAEDGKMAYSVDGLTWALIAQSGFDTTQINAITFGGVRFVAVGNDGKIVYSR